MSENTVKIDNSDLVKIGQVQRSSRIGIKNSVPKHYDDK